MIERFLVTFLKKYDGSTVIKEHSCLIVKNPFQNENKKKLKFVSWRNETHCSNQIKDLLEATEIFPKEIEKKENSDHKTSFLSNERWVQETQDEKWRRKNNLNARQCTIIGKS